MKKQITLIFSLIFVTASLAAAQTARRTITNNDLEKYRQARLQAEADYRANYKKLGMPSPEELERMEAERRAWHAEFARKSAAQNQQNENYFQEQANLLRSQIVNVQAQINYLRGEIGKFPNQNPLFVTPDQVLAIGILPSGSFHGRFPGRINRPGAVNLQGRNVQAARDAAAAMPNPHAGTSLQNMPGTGVKAVIGANPIIRGRRHGRPFFYGGFPFPYAVSSTSGARDELVANLRYLEQTKAGLLAQLELMREEARRSGIRID